MRKFLSAALAATFVSAAAGALPTSTQQVAERIGVPDGGWDLLAVDQEAHRVLVARTDGVTAIAVLATGLLGGAIATQLRAGMPLFSHILFGVCLSMFMWAALWLRDERLRALLPIRRGESA